MHIDMDIIVLLLVGVLVAYAAYKWKNLAEPITVAIIVLTFLLVLLSASDAPVPQTEAPSVAPSRIVEGGPGLPSLAPGAR
ncbi:hypothetical protein [Streptomyces flaveus]|uniref:hypothetical protein n=1 Tax=Streptomyces flaveus TaxID=66370 RepID=UPI003333D0A6